MLKLCPKAYMATVLAALLLPGGRLASRQLPSGLSEARADTVALREVSVSGVAERPLRVGADGAAAFDRRAVASVPRLLGEADPLRYLATLPGVSVASDYASGVSADGMGYSGTSFRLNGIPLHFPYHFGGMFSTVSSPLFPSVRFEKTSKGSGFSDVAGAVASMESRSAIPEKVSAEVNAGMLASSLYASVPFGEKVSVALSGRVSYIDALYGSLLRGAGTAARYNLADCDLVVNYAPTQADCVEITTHYNGDRIRYDDSNYALATGLKWHNVIAGARWHHRAERLEMTNQLYYTRFHNRLTLDMVGVGLTAPTGIDEGGVRGTFNFTFLPAPWRLSAGYNGRLFVVTPQYAALSGIGQGSGERRSAERSAYGSVYADAEVDLPGRWMAEAGVSLDAYGAGGYRTFSANPRVGITKRWRGGAVSFHASRSRQYLHTVGFSDLGLSSNFKIAVGRRLAPSDCYSISMGANVNLTDGLVAGAEAFYKRVIDEPEYLGGVLDVIVPGYVAENYIRRTRGWNAGGSLSLRLVRGPFSASASYAYTHTRRRMAGEASEFSSAAELRDVVRVSVGWRPGAHWLLTAAFHYTTGHPYTPVAAVYFIGEQLMMEYGPRNSARLPAYHRLDLGATYSFHTGGRVPLRHELNLSLVNAYGRRNVEIRTFAVDYDDGTFYRRDITSLYRFLPSLSYAIIF